MQVLLRENNLLARGYIYIYRIGYILVELFS